MNDVSDDFTVSRLVEDARKGASEVEVPVATRDAPIGEGRRRFQLPIRSWALYPLLLFVAMFAWAASSPPGSSPDEHYHLISAWCSLGSRDGLCAPGSAPDTRVVSLQLLETSCFRFHPESAGICPDYGDRTIETNFGNFVNYYPNGFFTIMGMFASPSIETSVLWMRTFNAALYAGGLAALLFLVGPGRRGNYMLGSLVSLVPLGMFIVPSVNPSSWSVTSATLLWGAAVEVGRSDRTRRLGLGLVAAVALTLAVASRADAAAFAVLALGLAWLGNLKLGRRALVSGAALAGVIVVALIWVLSLGSLARILAAIEAEAAPAAPNAWLTAIQALPEIYIGAFGTSYLGWLDTPIAPITWVLAAGMYAMALFWGIRRCGWRKSASLAVVLLVGVTVPLIGAALRPTGLLQPRYFLPLVVLAVMVALAEDNDDGPQLSWNQAAVLATSLAIANANALYTNLRRYVTGLGDAPFDLNLNVGWWWPGWQLPPMAVFALGAVAFLGAATTVGVAGCWPSRPAQAVAPRRLAA